jgi:hypothetical protein
MTERRTAHISTFVLGVVSSPLESFMVIESKFYAENPTIANLPNCSFILPSQNNFLRNVNSLLQRIISLNKKTYK